MQLPLTRSRAALLACLAIATASLVVLVPSATARTFSFFANATLVDASPGFATLWNGALPQPGVSALNITQTGEVRAGAAVSRLTSSVGSVYVQGGGHVVIDVMARVGGAGPINCDTRCSEPNVRA